MELDVQSLIAIFISIIGLLFQHFAITTKIQSRLASLETKVDLFWHSIENNVIQMLKTYPTYIRKDVLLDKLANNELDICDAQELRTILIGEFTKSKELAYVLVLGRIEQVIFELKKTKKKSLWTLFKL